MARTRTAPSAALPRKRKKEDVKVDALPRRPGFRFPLTKVFIYLIISLGAILFMMPFLWMLATSMMTPNEIARGAFVPKSDLIGLHAINDTDLDRPMVEFLYAEAEVDFNGVSISIDYDTHPDGGVFDVYIDNQFFGTVDTQANTATTGNQFVVDSYPAVQTLTNSQTISLPDDNHTLQIVYNNDASRGEKLFINQVIATDGTGTETILTSGDPDFEVKKGFWEAFAVTENGDLQAVQWDEDNAVWQLDGEAIETSQVLQRSTNIGFPSYFEQCCYRTINSSAESQGYAHEEYISQKRPSGGHALWSPPLTGKTYVITGSASNYFRVWKDGNFKEYFVNSAIITFITLIGQTLFSIMAAYAFAKMKFPGKNVIFGIFLLTIFIPTMVTLIPNVLTVTAISEWSQATMADINEFLGFTLMKPESAAWINNWPALVFPFLASTFGIFLLRQFFIQVPDELWDAAQIDGAGHIRYLFRIVVPISRAAITTIVLFSFIATWDALEWPLLVTSDDTWRPIAVGLYDYRNDEGARPNLLMAAAMIALFPVIIVYFLAQKQFTEGIATSGLKG